MKRHFLSARVRLRPALASWGCVLVTVCVGMGVASLLSTTESAVRSQTVPSRRAASEPAKHRDHFWYFRSGQYRADARTVAAALRYLVEPEPDPFALTNTAALTNGSAQAYPAVRSFR